MSRAAKSEAAILLQEARGIELVAADIDVEQSRIEEYWALSADLINLVYDIEAYGEQASATAEEDDELLALRRRLREITSRLTDLSVT